MSTPTTSGSSQKFSKLSLLFHHKILTRSLTMKFSAVSKLFSANAGWVWTCFSDSLPLLHQAVEVRKRGRNVFHLQFLNWKESGQTPSPDTVVEIFGQLETHQQSCGNPTVVIHLQVRKISITSRASTSICHIDIGIFGQWNQYRIDHQ